MSNTLILITRLQMHPGTENTLAMCFLKTHPVCWLLSQMCHTLQRQESCQRSFVAGTAVCNASHFNKRDRRERKGWAQRIYLEQWPYLCQISRGCIQVPSKAGVCLSIQNSLGFLNRSIHCPGALAGCLMLVFLFFGLHPVSRGRGSNYTARRKVQYGSQVVPFFLNMHLWYHLSF